MADMNYRWPAKEGNGMVPWWIILYRVPFFLIILFGKLILAVGVFGYTFGDWYETTEAFKG